MHPSKQMVRLWEARSTMQILIWRSTSKKSFSRLALSFFVSLSFLSLFSLDLFFFVSLNCFSLFSSFLLFSTFFVLLKGFLQKFCSIFPPKESQKAAFQSKATIRTEPIKSLSTVCIKYSHLSPSSLSEHSSVSSSSPPSSPS